MRLPWHNHAFAQVGRIFFIRMPAHFDCSVYNHAVYPKPTRTNTSLNARGIALSARINTSLASTRT